MNDSVLTLTRSASSSNSTVATTGLSFPSGNYQKELMKSEMKTLQLDKDLQSMRTSIRLLKRELEVYKQSLREAERVGDLSFFDV